MTETLPGVMHWTAFHEGIRQEVSSYYVRPARALIDPMLPPGGTEALAEEPPQMILLTNRHHYRHADRFVDAFGCSVHCHEQGLHEFTADQGVRGFLPGDQLAPGIAALAVGAICPDDAALLLTEGRGALAFADGLIRRGSGRLALVSDPLLGDDPEAVKRGLQESLRRLLDEPFDALLFAHGKPMPTGGKDALTAFLQG
jgi:hypothetical protein